jgi:hypothetical protein
MYPFGTCLEGLKGKAKMFLSTTGLWPGFQRGTLHIDSSGDSLYEWSAPVLRVGEEEFNMHRVVLNRYQFVANAQNSEQLLSSVDTGRGKARPADMTLLEGCGVDADGLLHH